MTGLLVLGVVIAAATVFGLWRLRTEGRVNRAPAGRPALTSADLGADLGATATLVQFSSAFCAPCRAARQVLGQAAQTVDGVRHVEIDAESHLDLVRRVGVTRTPTTFVLDPDGRIVRRATGVPRLSDVRAAIADMAAS
ncbi:MAG: TlpA family protein disulfide reductase [Jiangellaceae bacterium]